MKYAPLWPTNVGCVHIAREAVVVDMTAVEVVGADDTGLAGVGTGDDD